MALVYERVPPLWTTMHGDLCVIRFYPMNELFNRSALTQQLAIRYYYPTVYILTPVKPV